MWVPELLGKVPAYASLAVLSPSSVVISHQNAVALGRCERLAARTKPVCIETKQQALTWYVEFMKMPWCPIAWVNDCWSPPLLLALFCALVAVHRAESSCSISGRPSLREICLKVDNSSKSMGASMKKPHVLVFSTDV